MADGYTHIYTCIVYFGQSDKAKAAKGGKKRGALDEAAVTEIDAAAVPAREEAPTLPSVAEEAEGGATAAAEISSMLRAKKKRRKQQAAEEKGRDYVAFDPLDWRSKQFG